MSTLSTKLKLYILSTVLTGGLLVYNHYLNCTIDNSTTVSYSIDTNTDDITLDDVRIKIYSSPYLTDEEKAYLYNEDYFTDILPYINQTEFKKEFLERITDLDIRSIDDPLAQELIKSMDTEISHTTGLYNPKHKNIIFVQDYNNIKYSTVAHEFVHLCQANYDYSFFTETTANMYADEYFGQYIPNSNAYVDEVYFTKLLMETIGAEPIKQYIFTGNFDILNKRIKDNLTDVEYQQFIYWIKYDLVLDSEVRNSELLFILSELYSNIYHNDLSNDEIITWLTYDYEHETFYLQRPYLNQRLGETCVTTYNSGVESKEYYESITLRDNVFEGITK